MDDQPPMAPEVDLYTPHLTLSRSLYFDRVMLEKGPHRVTILSRDRSHDSKGTEIGVDLIWLWPEK